MPYGWTTEALLLESHHWMEYAPLMTIMNTFKFKQFSVKANRDAMLTTLQNLQHNTPFSPSNRFPESKIYIDLNHSVPMRLLQQLTRALDYSDRQTEKGRSTTDHEKDRSYSNFEDAKVAFYSSVDAILDLIGPLPIESAHIFGIYVQSSFESEHDLLWT